MSLFHSPLLNKQAVRRPAVAGRFYSDNPDELKREIEGYILAGKRLEEYPDIIISPHAGYIFSGPVAGRGYAAVDPGAEKVIISGPSHYKRFKGISIPDVTAYETPLGSVPLAAEEIAKLRKNPLVNAWPDAHDKEHCIEVQIPFLQVVLDRFSIVPVVTGDIEPHEVAELVWSLMDDRTLVVISTDFSHYHSHEKAGKIDSVSMETILKGNVNGPIDGCGELSVRAGMILAQKLGLRPQLLDARNSYETCPQYGGRDRVVGYASIVYQKKNGCRNSET